jgi:hypothetical protein
MGYKSYLLVYRSAFAQIFPRSQPVTESNTSTKINDSQRALLTECCHQTKLHHALTEMQFDIFLDALYFSYTMKRNVSAILAPSNNPTKTRDLRAFSLIPSCVFSIRIA